MPDRRLTAVRIRILIQPLEYARGSPFAIFHPVQRDINSKTATLGHYRKADRISVSTRSKVRSRGPKGAAFAG